MRGTRGDQARDESVEVGGFGGDEEQIAFQSMGHLVDLEMLNERFCGGIRPAHVELRMMSATPDMRRLRRTCCGTTDPPVSHWPGARVSILRSAVLPTTNSTDAG